MSAARSSSAVFRSRSRSAAAGGRYRSAERRSVRVARTVTPTPSPNPTLSQNKRLITSPVLRARIRLRAFVDVGALDVLLSRPAPLEQLAQLAFATLGAGTVVNAGLDLGRPEIGRASCRRNSWTA